MKAIFHADRNWGIGKNNDLMFSLPKDMKFFRETTLRKVVVMGWNTLLSFPNGQPLKNRTNVVLCPDEVSGDFIHVRNLDELFAEIGKYSPDDVYVIGGASVYRALIPYCSEVLVTKVDADGGADTFVPDLDADPDFELVYESERVEDNGYALTFCTYRNRRL
ncbi:MAG: dihydrofolate reductase [Clostridia bacterium]|jgi:dihydrofolate reductase|nr:dihydrofolate reductase [Clostridia bacterium]